MKRIALFCLLLLFIGMSGRINAQSTYSGITCPPNIDYELGNLSNWIFWNGSVATVAGAPSYTWGAPTPPVFGQEVIMTGTGRDAFGGFPVVPPGGGAYALKLGNDSTSGSGCSKAVYYVHVPVGSTHFSIIYQYAVVFQDPGHPASDQPRFTVSVKDSITDVLIPCAKYDYVAGAIPGFILSPVTRWGTIYYKPWSSASINLSGMGGKTVTIEIIAQDCTQGGHFGYGYFDATCGLFAIDAKICDDTLATLTGPSGFSSYQWWDSATFMHNYGNTQVITMPIPKVPTTFAVIIQPYIGFGCPDTLYTTVQPSYLKVNASNDTQVCVHGSALLDAGATDSAIAMPLTYSWTPALGLSCTTCANPTATPFNTTVYSVAVTDKAGCTKIDAIKVKVDTVAVAIGTVSDSCYSSSNGSATATLITGVAPYNYLWNTSPIQTSATASGLVAGTYTVTVTDSIGCSGTGVAKVTSGVLRNLTIVSTAGPTTCLGHDGIIVLSGLIADSVYTFTYTLNGVVQSPQVRTADATGTDTLVSLPAGLYSDITVDVKALGRPFCPFNTVGPVTLIDPPTPPLPSVGNNGPLCIGDTLKLTAKDATPGVFFYWTGPSGFNYGKADTSIANIDLTQAGDYTVTVTKNACSSSNTTKVVLKPYPVPSATGDTACTGGDIALHSTSANGAEAYRWSGPDAYFSFEQNPVLHGVKMAAAGSYTVIATLDGCTKTATASVTIVETPSAPVVTDTVYCQYDGSVAIPSLGTDVAWYASNGKPYPGIPVPNTDVAGIFTWYADQRVSGPGTDPVVCVSPRALATVQVYPKDIPTLGSTDTVICTGNEITFSVDNLGDDRNGIRWSIGEGDSTRDVNPLRHSFDGTGIYTISVTPLHKYCPDFTLSRVIHVYPYPALDLGPDTAICIGSRPITLADNINGGDLRAKWLWNTNETGSSIVVTKPGVYYAKVVINGCPASDSVTVLNDCYMDIPNAFTPNGDGSNDYFLPRQFLTKGLTGFKMDIFNRWGTLVFSTSSVNGLGWDGKLNDIAQPEGVYVYRIEATFKDGQMESHTGNLTLLR